MALANATRRANSPPQSEQRFAVARIDVLAVKSDRASQRCQHAADQPQQRRLAAPGAAHDRDDLAPRKRHRHVVQNDATSVVSKRHVVDLNERVVIHLGIVGRARVRLHSPAGQRRIVARQQARFCASALT